MDRRDHGGVEHKGRTASLEVSRREALHGVLAIGGLLFLPTAGCDDQPSGPRLASSSPSTSTSTTESTMPGKYELPDLPYAYDALEPHIDAATVKLHHDKHHAGYVKGANAAAKALAEARVSKDFQLVDHWTQKLAFHASGHLLHSLYWENMAPAGTGGQPSAQLAAAIKASFGSIEAFTAQLTAAAKTVEGSGWGVLGWLPTEQALVVLQCQNHEKLTIWSVVPLLVVDVWEHAYYLEYQNQRGKYLEAWTKVINWKDVSDRFARASVLKGLK